MRISKLILPAMLALPLTFIACGDDSDDDPDTGGKGGTTSGKGGTTSGKGGSGKGGTTTAGGDTGAGGDTTAGGDTSVGGDTGEGGSAGAAPVVMGCEAYTDVTTREPLPNPIDDTFEATADTIWVIEDQVFVSGTLDIEPGTCLEGMKEPVGVIIVQQGGTINAPGTEEAPIIFTSAQEVGMRAPEDWGGIVILGSAPLHDVSPTRQYEGLVGTEYTYGGAVAADNSGTMTFVRIEFSGFEINADEEINGLTMAGVGSGTTIENVMVTNTADDCFEWFGGTVATSNLIANNCGDDYFDIDQGYVGTGENWFGRTTPDFVVSENPNGFEWDGVLDPGTPQTNVTATNVTICGANEAGLAVEPHFAMVLREAITGAIDNVAITGFEGGVDVRDAVGTEVAPDVTIANSNYWGLLGDFAGVTDLPPFNEDTWYTSGTGNTVDTDPAPYTAAECLGAAGPAAAVKDSGIGAFTDSATWLDGDWVVWTTN